MTLPILIAAIDQNITARNISDLITWFLYFELVERPQSNWYSLIPDIEM